MHRKGEVVSRSELIEHIYAQDFDRDSNTIEVFVARLRRKLGVNVIKTVRGLGYRLEEPGGSLSNPCAFGCLSAPASRPSSPSPRPGQAWPPSFAPPLH